MGTRTRNRIGINYADNIIDPLLSFDQPSTWSTTDTGSVSIDTNVLNTGSGSLKLLNTDPTNDFLVTNTSQSTVIPYDADFRFSFYMKKDEVDEFMTLEVVTYVGVSVFNTQSYVLGSETTADDVNDVFERFVADVDFNFTKGDDVTFTFNLKGKSGTLLANTTVWIDSIQLEAVNTSDKMPSKYSKPIGASPFTATTLTTDTINLSSLNTAPASASDTGTEGQIRFDADYMYVCTATDTWKRVAIATW